MGSNRNLQSAIKGLHLTTTDCNICVVCRSPLPEPVAFESSCVHRFCRDCIIRENGPRRRPVDNQSLSESERRDGGQGSVLSHNTHPAEPLAVQVISEQHQQPSYHQENDEQNGGPSPANNETDQTVGPRMNGKVRQQGDTRQINGESGPIQELNQIEGRTANADERWPGHQQVDDRSGSGANYSMMNGAGASDASVSIPGQETQLVSDQFVNGLQQQIPHQQEGGALANGLNYPTQEADPHASQIPDRPEYQPPYPEVGVDEACEYHVPVQETGPVAGQLPDEQDDLPPDFQQLNVTEINGVSSTGQTDQSVEHSCSRQEIKLWKNILTRSRPQKEPRKKMNASETLYIIEVPEVQQLRQVDVNGVAAPFFSFAIDTDSYGYKFGIRVYLNGVGEGSGRYVSLFVHMMKGEYDDFLRWPYTGRVTLSILDRSEARHNDISQIVLAKPNSSAFQRPRETISRKGCGFVKFALIEKVFGPQYVKDDKLFIKIEFSI